MRRSPVLGTHVAVDLGTANTIIYVRDKGIVLDEPSSVAVSSHGGDLLAVGEEAERMVGRTPSHIQTIRPLADGVVNDLSACELMLRAFIQRVGHRRWFKPRMVMCMAFSLLRLNRVHAHRHPYRVLTRPYRFAWSTGATAAEAPDRHLVAVIPRADDGEDRAMLVFCFHAPALVRRFSREASPGASTSKEVAHEQEGHRTS